MAVKGKQTNKRAHTDTKVTKLNDYFLLLQQHVCLCACVCVCCYGRVNLFLCSGDCLAIFIINHVSYAEQTDIVFDSFSISFCWNVNRISSAALTSYQDRIVHVHTHTRTKREEKKAYEWIERKVNHHQATAAPARRRSGILLRACVCVSIVEKWHQRRIPDWVENYLTANHTDSPRIDVYTLCAQTNILLECLHALNCNYVASFLLRVVGESKTINCLFADRLFGEEKKSKWWLTIV